MRTRRVLVPGNLTILLGRVVTGTLSQGNGTLSIGVRQRAEAYLPPHDEDDVSVGQLTRGKHKRARFLRSQSSHRLALQALGASL